MPGWERVVRILHAGRRRPEGFVIRRGLARGRLFGLRERVTKGGSRLSEVSRGTGLEPELRGELVQDVQVTHMAWLNVLSGDPRESLVQGGRFHGEASLFEESREPCMRGASHLCGARNGGRQSDTMLVEKRSLERERQRQSARWERELPLSKGRGGRGGAREDSGKAGQRSRDRGERRERGESGARDKTAARQVNGQRRGDEGEKKKHRPGRGGNAPKSRGLQQNERGEKERGARREQKSRLHSEERGTAKRRILRRDREGTS